MAAIDRYLVLKNSGLDDQTIIAQMREEGFSTTEINDSINQAKIKEAVEQEPTMDFQQSILQNNQELQTNNFQQTFQEEQPSYPQYNQQYNDYFQTLSYGEDEAIVEVVEQILTRKLNRILKEIEDNKRNNELNKLDITETKERLKKIEENIDYLQKAIIGKIGEFGNTAKIIQKDLENMHDTMSKLMNPLIDNYNELKKFNANKAQ